jgi:hypothetical protein
MSFLIIVILYLINILLICYNKKLISKNNIENLIYKIDNIFDVDF